MAEGEIIAVDEQPVDCLADKVLALETFWIFEAFLLWSWHIQTEPRTSVADLVTAVVMDGIECRGQQANLRHGRRRHLRTPPDFRHRISDTES